MVTTTEPRSEPATRTPYERAWRTAAIVVAGAWSAVALFHSHWLALAGLVAMLGAYGGIVAVRRPLTSAEGRHQYVVGALVAGAGSLVVIGMSHQIGIGLATVAVLGATSPWVLRWMAGD